VVEDDAIIRMAALELVTNAGFEAVEARDAHEAIRILETRPEIPLVFTDVGMPGKMDGIELAHYIRRRWPPLNLIVASGKATIAESHLPTGSKFFPKPYDARAVVGAIAAMLSDASDRDMAQ
jgi:two-component system, response regulator PdtaR